jgi:hypothetical protein
MRNYEIFENLKINTKKIKNKNLELLEFFI